MEKKPITTIQSRLIRFNLSESIIIVADAFGNPEHYPVLL